MSENRDYIVKADIRRIPSKRRKTILFVYVILVIGILILGLIQGTRTYHSNGGKTIYGDPYPEHDNKYTGWFEITFTYEGEGWQPWGWGAVSKTYPGNIAAVVTIFAILIMGPFVVDAIYKRECKVTDLKVTTSQVMGSYNSFLFKKSLQIPIEKIDNLTVMSGFFDKIRTGKTLGVCSASGVIKLHFVQNAEDVVFATMERVDEIKREGNSIHPISQPVVATPVATLSTTDKIKELISMKENGLISEEEFERKRMDLLNKM